MLVNFDILTCNFLTHVANVLGLVNHYHLLPLIQNVDCFRILSAQLFFYLDHQCVTHGYHIHHDKYFHCIYIFTIQNGILLYLKKNLQVKVSCWRPCKALFECTCIHLNPHVL